MTKRDEAKPFSDEELDDVQGAGAAQGILIAATTENNVAGITADQKTIIGGFKSMTGMDSKDDSTFMADVFNEPHD